MRSPIPKKHARIEIIPLIDIMFFLLASFMMVSLSQTHMKGIRVNLPSANSPPRPPNEVKDYVAIRVTEGGLVYFDNVPVNYDDVLDRLYQMAKANKDVKVSLSAEQLATHGDVIGLLDKIRLAGITKIGYQIKTAAAQGAPGTVAPPAAPPPPP
ncbi:MAG TPA: biopolymer transporter ExbD [Chthoniobacterales bacterium]|nr:biopolymer transporter ExbD [Chthoniobacterales bacterium]